MAREIFAETKQFTLTQGLLNKVRHVAGNLPDEQPIVDLVAWNYNPQKSWPGGRYAHAKLASQEWLDIMHKLTQQERKEMSHMLIAVFRSRKKQTFQLTPEQNRAIAEFGFLDKINTVGDLRVASEKGVLSWFAGISEKRELFLKLAFKQEQLDELV